MTAILNKSGRAVYTQVCSGKDENGRVVITSRHSILPAELTTIPKKCWDVVKEQNIIKKMLDSGELIEGGGAKSGSKEMEKDVELQINDLKKGKKKKEKED